MKILFYSVFAFTMLFTQETAKAQSSTLDSRLTSQLDIIQSLVQSGLRRMNNQEKLQALEILTETKRSLKLLVTDLPIPGSGTGSLPSNRINMFCTWMDGYSSGISQRGWHLIEQMNGYLFSKQFYGNMNRDSEESCNKQLIVETIQPSRLSLAKRTTCTCNWYPGNKNNQPSERGWHMTYQISVPAEAGQVVVEDSVGFYGNMSTSSENQCLQQLRANAFRCN